MRKTDKRIAQKLYLIGMSKNNIYSTMKDNGFPVKRKEIRNYLEQSSFNKFEKSKYRDRYLVLKSPYGKGAGSVKKNREALNKRFLQWSIVSLLKDKKIKQDKYTRKLIKYDKYIADWVSP